MWSDNSLYLWLYQADVCSIVDGDTLDVRVDMGFHTARTIRVRLDGVDTSEVYGVSHDSEEFAEGRTHSDFVKEWVSEGNYNHSGSYPFVVQTSKTGKYGRYIAEVWRKYDSARLTADLIEAFPEVEDADE